MSKSPLYFVEVAGKSLWVATMPHGTTDRKFADLVAASINGARVVAA